MKYEIVRGKAKKYIKSKQYLIKIVVQMDANSFLSYCIYTVLEFVFKTAIKNLKKKA